MQKLVSCICVTHKKVVLLKRAIINFENQTYEKKELIIMYEETDLETAQFFESTTFSHDIILIKDKGVPKKSLGELRNIAIQKARGYYFCQWDDDDWYHPYRIEVQVFAITKAKSNASILTRWLLFDYTTRKAYLSHIRLWEGSLLCTFQINHKVEYDKKNQGEDTDFINFLVENDMLAGIPQMPYLYIYTYNKLNTWNYEHFAEIINVSQELTKANSLLIYKIPAL